MSVTIGVTGGIGSGKTTVCKVFRLLGIPVFEADVIAKEIINTNENLRGRISQLFGSDVYNSDGFIKRKKLADIVFRDERKLNQLNGLVHPAVRDEFLLWSEQKKNYPYVVLEAAILFESGFDSLTDYTILVTAPEDERLKRVVLRDGSSAAEVKERMDRQFPERKKQELADIVLQNDNRHLIIPDIIKIDKKLRENGKIW
jgi:dephospho-CoA kinase